MACSLIAAVLVFSLGTAVRVGDNSTDSDEYEAPVGRGLLNLCLHEGGTLDAPLATTGQGTFAWLSFLHGNQFNYDCENAHLSLQAQSARSAETASPQWCSDYCEAGSGKVQTGGQCRNQCQSAGDKDDKMRCTRGPACSKTDASPRQIGAAGIHPAYGDAAEVAWLDVSTPTGCRCDEAPRTFGGKLETLSACQDACLTSSCQQLDYKSRSGWCSTYPSTCVPDRRCDGSWTAMQPRQQQKKQQLHQAKKEERRTDVWWNSISPEFIHKEYTQQFKVTEKRKTLLGIATPGKSYKFELEEYEMETGYWSKKKKEKEVDRKLAMKVAPHVLTAHGRMAITIGRDGVGDGKQKFNLVKAWGYGVNVLGYYSWRVVPEGDDDTILFTIQKSHKGYWKGSKASWRIFQGRKRFGKVLYYGVGSDDLDDPDFKFYQSKDDYEYESKKKWVASIEAKKHKDKGWKGETDEYKVKVRPKEDAVLILLTSVCMDYVADANRKDD